MRPGARQVTALTVIKKVPVQYHKPDFYLSIKKQNKLRSHDPSTARLKSVSKRTPKLKAVKRVNVAGGLAWTCATTEKSTRDGNHFEQESHFFVKVFFLLLDRMCNLYGEPKSDFRMHFLPNTNCC